MYIPSYQIHNILKDFTQRLKNGGQRPDAGDRLESVVNKVSVTIMNRVTRIGEEEARRRSRRPPPASPVDKQQPTTFHYHTLGRDHRKLKNHLCVENSRQLIERFFSLVEPAADAADDVSEK